MNAVRLCGAVAPLIFSLASANAAENTLSQPLLGQDLRVESTLAAKAGVPAQDLASGPASSAPIAATAPANRLRTRRIRPNRKKPARKARAGSPST